MKFPVLLSVLLSMMLGAQTFASFEVGIGSTSGTGGRLTPSLAAGAQASSWGVFASTTGVANSYYYQSNYQLSVYHLLSNNTMWGGKISPGFGLGTMYTIRSFRDEGAPNEMKSDDFLIGPALRLHWIFFDTVYIGFDAIWGLRSLANIVGLSYQDYTCLSIGVAL